MDDEYPETLRRPVAVSKVGLVEGRMEDPSRSAGRAPRLMVEDGMLP